MLYLIYNIQGGNMSLKVEEKDIWQFLAEDKKPVVIYGMGNGAEKIISVLKKYGVKVAAVFASDDFVRGHSFLGYKVEKYSDICNKFNDFNVVLAFATHIDSVLENIKRINGEHKVFAPDVPVAGDSIFTKEYFEKNRKNLNLFITTLQMRKAAVFTKML